MLGTVTLEINVWDASKIEALIAMIERDPRVLSTITLSKG